jgi:hypothetical protein
MAGRLHLGRLAEDLADRSVEGQQQLCPRHRCALLARAITVEEFADRLARHLEPARDRTDAQSFGVRQAQHIGAALGVWIVLSAHDRWGPRR